MQYNISMLEESSSKHTTQACCIDDFKACELSYPSVLCQEAAGDGVVRSVGLWARCNIIGIPVLTQHS